MKIDWFISSLQENQTLLYNTLDLLIPWVYYLADFPSVFVYMSNRKGWEGIACAKENIVYLCIIIKVIRLFILIYIYIFNNTKKQVEAVTCSGALKFNLFYFNGFVHAASSTKLHGRVLEIEWSSLLSNHLSRLRFK